MLFSKNIFARAAARGQGGEAPAGASQGAKRGPGLETNFAPPLTKSGH